MSREAHVRFYEGLGVEFPPGLSGHCVVEYLQVVDGTGRSETFRDVTISFRDTRFQTKTSGWSRGGRMSDAIEPHGLR
jgi:hypothetical protein